MGEVDSEATQTVNRKYETVFLFLLMVYPVNC
uniref:Uncharacterized protein n=1 Tax=Anguilla anguilla TaxID=7936 RepID=A0A0E9RUS3_ANGAN